MESKQNINKSGYKKETFLENIFENYKDYIKNMVLKYQKYDDVLNKAIPEMYSYKMLKEQDERCIDLLSFFRIEAENIYIMKGVSFIKEARDVLKAKYRLLRNGIKSSGSGTKYFFNQEAFQFFLDHIDQINWSVISNDVYSNGLIIEETLSETMEEMFMAYGFHDFNSEPRVYYSDPLVVLIDDSFNKLIDTMNKLKELSEESRSSHLTTIIVREALDLMIMVYASIKTISIAEKE